MDVTNINLDQASPTESYWDGNGNGTLDASSTPSINPLNGGTYCFLASGAIPASGCTLTLQHKVGSNYVDIGDDAVLTSPGGCVFTTSQSDIRLVVAGNNNATNSIDVVIAPV